MKIHSWLQKRLPTWEYFCPACNSTLNKKALKLKICPSCRLYIDLPLDKLRAPPRLLRDANQLSKYVHKHIFPMLTPNQRDWLAQWFTEIFSDGFESNDWSAWTGTTGTVATVSDPVHCGSYAGECDADNEYGNEDFTAQNPVYSRGYFRFAALPAGDRNIKILQFRRVGTGSSPVVYVVDDSGTIKWRVFGNDGNYDTPATPNPVIDTWYCVELKVDAESETRLYVDGTSVASAGGTSGDTFDRMYAGRWNNATDSITAYVDCVIIADAYIGPEAEEEEVEVEPFIQALTRGGALRSRTSFKSTFQL